MQAHTHACMHAGSRTFQLFDLPFWCSFAPVACVRPFPVQQSCKRISTEPYWVWQISKEENIDCDFEHVSGYLYAHDEHPSTYQQLEKELRAAHQAGVSGVQKVDLGG